MNINRYVAVEIRAFGQGMQKLFEGVAEVFAAIGAEEPDRLALEKAKWKHAADGVAENKSGANEGEHTHEKEESRAGSDGSDYDGNHIDMAAVPENDPPVMKEAKAAEKVAEAAGNAEHEEPVKDKKDVEKGKTAQSSVSQDDITKIIVQKIKQNRNNNEKIGQLLKTYGAARVGDLPVDKYEAFITDLSAI